MLVTRSTAVTPRAWEPALVPPAGAARATDRVTPAGSADAMLPVILAPVWFVVTAQVADASFTLVGLLPAAAVVMVSDGLPVKAIWLIGLTAMVTDWVAVWAEADPASEMTPRTRVSALRRAIRVFMEGTQEGVVRKGLR